MPTPANPTALAQQARRSYAERLLVGMPGVVQAIDQGAKLLAAAVAEPAVALKRRDENTADKAFYEGKIASARFFTRNVLPGLGLTRKLVEQSSLELMELPEESF